MTTDEILKKLKKWITENGIEYWEESGLTKPSIVICSKLNTVHFKEF